MRFALPGLVEKVLELGIVRMKMLPDKLHVTREREVDAIAEVVDNQGERYILHVEFQTEDDQRMPLRMIGYRVMLRELYELPVRQYCIYLGEKPTSMSNCIDELGLRYEYKLVSLQEIPYRLFLSSDKPEERLLAVLGDFGAEKPVVVFTDVMKSVARQEPSGLEGNKYFEQLRIISQLRNLDSQFNRAMEGVKSFFREERDPLYRRGIEKGIEKGIAEERARSHAEKLRSAKKIKENGLGNKVIADILGLPIADVEKL